MNKQELIEHVAKYSDLSKAQAERAINGVMDGIGHGLNRNGAVTLVGFGTFTAKYRASRTGRNPQTGEVIAIAGKRVAHFKPGKALSSRLNGEG